MVQIAGYGAKQRRMRGRQADRMGTIAVAGLFPKDTVALVTYINGGLNDHRRLAASLNVRHGYRSWSVGQADGTRDKLDQQHGHCQRPQPAMAAELGEQGSGRQGHRRKPSRELWC